MIFFLIWYWQHCSQTLINVLHYFTDFFINNILTQTFHVSFIKSKFKTVLNNLNSFEQFGTIWNNLNSFVQFWTVLNNFEQFWTIWTVLNNLEQFWTNLNIFEQFWKFLNTFKTRWIVDNILVSARETVIENSPFSAIKTRITHIFIIRESDIPLCIGRDTSDNVFCPFNIKISE